MVPGAVAAAMKHEYRYMPVQRVVINYGTTVRTARALQTQASVIHGAVQLYMHRCGNDVGFYLKLCWCFELCDWIYN